MERRRSPRRKVAGEATLRLSFADARSSIQTVTVKLLDESDQGLCFASPVHLPTGTHISIREGSGPGRSAQLAGRRARVQWCSIDRKDGFLAGVCLEAASPKDTAGATSAAQKLGDQDLPDHYEVMQLSYKADPETVHRVFRILAQRYHPDNQETGDKGMFHQLMTAYGVLSDAEKRAAYDARHAAARARHWKIFNDAKTSKGSEGERRKRHGILSLLCTKRMSEPQHPSMTIRDLEDLLGCPKEHLEFSLWYLKERNFVTRGDNGRYSITVDGVDAAEELDRQAGSMQPSRMLPA